MDNGKGKACIFGVAGAADAAAAASADAPGAADASVADALEAGAVGADACSPSLKGDKGGKRADRQPEQERQPEQASGSDGIEPGALGKGWTMVRVKPAYLGLLVPLMLLLMTQAAMVADIPPLPPCRWLPVSPPLQPWLQLSSVAPLHTWLCRRLLCRRFPSVPPPLQRVLSLAGQDDSCCAKMEKR